MISTNQFRSGLFIKLEGEVFMIIESEHYKPGKGGALVRTRLRNVKSGATIDKTFRSGETVEDIFVEEKKYQFLYYSEGRYYFMDNETYEQISLTEKQLGDAKTFLKENSEVTVSTYEGNILTITVPMFMNLKVAETEPGVRGDTVRAGTKNAKLETGATIQVPLFINVGDIITVDTRTGKYMGRA